MTIMELVKSINKSFKTWIGTWNRQKFVNCHLMPLFRVAIYTDSFTFKMTKVEFELLTDTEKLLMAEKGIRGGILQVIYQQGNNKCLKDYDSRKPLSYLMHWDVNNLYG